MSDEKITNARKMSCMKIVLSEAEAPVRICFFYAMYYNTNRVQSIG